MTKGKITTKTKKIKSQEMTLLESLQIGKFDKNNRLLGKHNFVITPEETGILNRSIFMI